MEVRVFSTAPDSPDSVRTASHAQTFEQWNKPAKRSLAGHLYSLETKAFRIMVPFSRQFRRLLLALITALVVAIIVLGIWSLRNSPPSEPSTGNPALQKPTAQHQQAG